MARMTHSHHHQDISDLSTVQRLSDGRVDLTYGRLATLLLWNICSDRSAISALDIFGGNLVRIQDLVDWNKTVLSGS